MHGTCAEVSNAICMRCLQDDEDAMLAAAIAASLQDTPGQQQPQPARAQQTFAGASISHPTEAVGQTPAGAQWLKVASNSSRSLVPCAVHIGYVSDNAAGAAGAGCAQAHSRCWLCMPGGPSV